MILTIEIDAETAADLSAEAERRHQPLEQVAAERLYSSRIREAQSDRDAALARIHSGFYQSRLNSSDTLIARKQEERSLEERRWGQ